MGKTGHFTKAMRENARQRQKRFPVAKHPRPTWETAELWGDKRRTAGVDFVDGSVVRSTVVCR